KHDVANLGFADALTDIKIDYKERFKEKLPTQDVLKIAGEKNLSLDLAYKEFISDRVEKQREDDVKAQIEQAKKDAVAEFATAHNLPIVPSHSDVTHVLDYKNVASDPAGRISGAVKDFMTRNK